MLREGKQWKSLKIKEKKKHAITCQNEYIPCKSKPSLYPLSF
jgi:hypothetical protein